MPYIVVTEQAHSTLLCRSRWMRNMNTATKIRIYEQTLTDGSKVYGVIAGTETFDCSDETGARDLAQTIYRFSLNTELDDADYVQRAA